jgi:ABC-2 type transport system permease protein
MTTAIAHSGHMTVRHLRGLARQPWYIAITLVQPVIWLLLFGSLFKRIVEIPGFATTSYVDFLTPSVVVMTALFSSAWSGMSVIQDLDRGVMDRFLVSPTRRGALMAGSLSYQAIVTAIQSLIVVAIGLVAGARFPGGAAGMVVVVAASVLLAVAFASLSNGLALLVRKEETLIAATQFVMLPLIFLSSSFMPQNLVPGWIQQVARFNPVNWAVQAGREALSANPDWGLVLSRTGWLSVLAVVCAWLATLAFRSYQRSV